MTRIYLDCQSRGSGFDPQCLQSIYRHAAARCPNMPLVSLCYCSLRACIGIQCKSLWINRSWGSTWSSHVTPGYFPDSICSSSHGLRRSRPDLCILHTHTHTHTHTHPHTHTHTSMIQPKMKYWYRTYPIYY